MEDGFVIVPGLSRTRERGSALRAVIAWADKLVKNGNAVGYKIIEDVRSCCGQGCGHRNAVILVETSEELERSLAAEGHGDPLYRAVLMACVDHHNERYFTMNLDVETVARFINEAGSIVQAVRSRDPFHIPGLETIADRTEREADLAAIERVKGLIDTHFTDPSEVGRTARAVLTVVARNVTNA